VILFAKDHHFTCAIIDRDNDKTIEYFDPLPSIERRDRDMYQLQKFARKYNEEHEMYFKHNTNATMSPKQNICGPMCIQFLHNAINLNTDFINASRYDKDDNSLMAAIFSYM
jgi:hypothetical protein